MAGFALRIALARGDLWGDEAASVMLSLRPTGELLATLAAAEPHPPLFPLLLKAWLRLAGTDELVARFPSIAAGTALVPTVGVLGRALGPRTAVGSAVLTALNPFLLWYTTEARMYGLAALAAAISFLLFVRLLQEPTRSSAILYGAATALALLSHYFLLFVGLAQAILGTAAIARRPRLSGPLAIGAAIALVPALLWATFASAIVGSYYGAATGSVDLLGIFGRTWLRLAAGWSVSADMALAIGAGGCAFALAGALAVRHRATGRAWMAWLFVPLATGLVVSLVRPMYQERYLAVVAPPYLLLLAAAVGLIQRRAGRAVALGLLVALALPAIANMAAGRSVRSQYGSHTAELNALARPGEAVLLVGPSQAPLYDYYASRGGVGLPVFGLPRAAPAPEPETSRELAGLASRFTAIWLFLYAVNDYDPAQVVERWLTRNTYRAAARWAINGRLVRFATSDAVPLAPAGTLQPLGGGWRVAAALPAASIAAGGLVPIDLDLRPPGQLDELPKLRLRLTDDRGLLWGEADEVLGAGFADASTLARLGAHREPRAVAILAGAPDGPLRVEAHMYIERPEGTRPVGTAVLGSIWATTSDRFWTSQIADFRPATDQHAGGWELLGWIEPQWGAADSAGQARRRRGSALDRTAGGRPGGYGAPCPARAADRRALATGHVPTRISGARSGRRARPLVERVRLARARADARLAGRHAANGEPACPGGRRALRRYDQTARLHHRAGAIRGDTPLAVRTSIRDRPGGVRPPGRRRGRHSSPVGRSAGGRLVANRWLERRRPGRRSSNLCGASRAISAAGRPLRPERRCPAAGERHVGARRPRGPWDGDRWRLRWRPRRRQRRTPCQACLGRRQRGAGWANERCCCG
jgi:hypothetical protein